MIQESVVPAHVCTLVQVEDEGVVLIIILVGLAAPDQATEAGDVGACGNGVSAPHTPATATRLEHFQAPVGCRGRSSTLGSRHDQAADDSDAPGCWLHEIVILPRKQMMTRVSSQIIQQTMAM